MIRVVCSAGGGGFCCFARPDALRGLGSSPLVAQLLFPDNLLHFLRTLEAAVGTTQPIYTGFSDGDRRAFPGMRLTSPPALSRESRAACQTHGGLAA